MTTQRVLDLVSETNARRLAYTVNSQTGDAELQRWWRCGQTDQQELILAYLGSRLYVDSPKASRKTYTGRWRVVEAKPLEQPRGKPDSGGVVETLRLGYLSTVLIGAGTVDFSEARLVDDRKLLSNSESVAGLSGAIAGTASDSPQAFLHVRWDNVNPAYHKAIVRDELLAANTIDNPVIKGQTFTGTYRQISAVASLAEDGSAIVDLWLAQPQFTINGVRNYDIYGSVDVGYIYHIPRDQCQVVIESLKADLGWKEKGLDIQVDESLSVGQEFCTLVVSRTNETALTASERDSTDDYFENQIGQTDEAQAAADTSLNADQTLGTIISTTVRKTSTGKFKNRKVTRTCKQRYWYYTFKSRNGNVYVWIGRHFTPEQYAQAGDNGLGADFPAFNYLLLSTTYNTHLDFTYDDYGRVNFTLRVADDDGDDSRSNWEGRGEDWYPLIRDRKGRTFNVAVYRCTNDTDALAYSNGTGVTGTMHGTINSPTYVKLDSVGGWTTGKKTLTHHRYIAVRCEMLATDIGT
jgi:hypothetical protein